MVLLIAAAGGDVGSIRGSSFPCLRLPRLVVPYDVLQQFLAGRAPPLVSSAPSISTDTTRQERAKCLSLIISYHFSKLTQSHIKRLQRSHFRLVTGDSSQTGTREGVASKNSTHIPVSRVNQRRFLDSEEEEEVDEEKGEGGDEGEVEEERKDKKRQEGEEGDKEEVEEEKEDKKREEEEEEEGDKGEAEEEREDKKREEEEEEEAEEEREDMREEEDAEKGCSEEDEEKGCAEEDNRENETSSWTPPELEVCLVYNQCYDRVK